MSLPHVLLLGKMQQVSPCVMGLHYVTMERTMINFLTFSTFAVTLWRRGAMVA